MTNTPTITTAANVRAEMARRGVSQTTMAGQVGISQSQFSKRLKGIIAFDINELAAISASLDVPLEALIAGAAQVA